MLRAFLDSVVKKCSPPSYSTSNGRYRALDLVWAIQYGDAALIKAYLRAGADLNQIFHRGETPVTLAIRARQYKVLKALISGGVNIEVRNSKGLTPLILAIKILAPKPKKSRGATRLIQEKAITEATRLIQEKAITEATKKCMVALRLILAKADTAATDRFGWNSLLIAAQLGHVIVTRALVESGADVNYKTPHRFTALHAAAQGGHLGVVKILLDAKADIEAKANKERNTPLMLAAIEGQEETIILLLERGANVQACNRYAQTPLMLSIQSGCLAAVKILLNAKANPNAQDNLGRTPLMYAIKVGDKDLISEFIAVLIAAGANKDITDSKAQSALEYCLTFNQSQVLSLLSNEPSPFGIDSFEDSEDMESELNNHIATLNF